MFSFYQGKITTIFIYSLSGNDSKEIVGDKDSQGPQTDFDFGKRGAKINRTPHQDIE